MFNAVRSILLVLFFVDITSVGICQAATAIADLPQHLLDAENDESAEPIEIEVADLEESVQSENFRSNFDRQIAAGTHFVWKVDSQLGRINKVFAQILFYDFGTSRLKQFGAADIQRQSAIEYFGIPERDSFTKLIPAALANFHDRYGRLPNGLYEAEIALREAGSALPSLPKGAAYAFEVATGEFMVEPRGVGLPMIAAWLLLGGLFLTFRMRLINLRGILHALALVCGKYDNPANLGQLSHFRAFTSSLASAVGLGSIGGVVVAVGLGGPGAAFWIMLYGVLSMSTKFTECTLGHIHRRVSLEGVVLGGPMRYLKSGFKTKKLVGFSMAPLGTLLSWLFAAICACVSLTAGNTLQVSQSLGSLQTLKGLEFLRTSPWIFGVLMMFMVAVVVLGGVRILGLVTGWIAPLMCLAYAGACGWIIAMNAENLQTAFQAIFIEAFDPKAIFAGSFVNAMVIGITRASLTTDAGLGTASIVHAAGRTDEPVREGIVALLEPLIVTVLMCLLTALAIGVTGVAETAEGQALAAKEQGTALILRVLSNGMPDWFSALLQAAMFLFAFSTCITWAYCGERCFVYMFGKSFSMLFLLVFIMFTFLGSVLSAANVMQFSVLLMLTLAIPNLLGVLLLNNVVLEELDDYWRHYRSRKRHRKGRLD